MRACRRLISFGSGRTARIALALACAGCATYRPVTMNDLSPQQRVRVQVEPEVLADLVAFAEGAEGHLSGRFVEMRGDSVAFRFETPSSYREVAMPRSAVLSIAGRASSPTRSVALSAAIVGGVGLAAWLGFEGRSSGDAGDDAETDALVPVLLFAIPAGR